MIRKRKFIGGFSMKVLAFIGYLALSSCGDSNNAFLENEDPLPVQLQISLTDSGYTSDGELIPMNTRADKSYFVTRIVTHALFILKKEKDNWIVVDKKTNVIKSSSDVYNRFGNEESLTLTDNGKNFVLLPGDYRFVLYLNNIPSMHIGQKIPLNSVEPMTFGYFPPADFYFAMDDVPVAKRESLEKDSSNKVELHLRRNSSLIRFILEGDDWTQFSDPTVTCKLVGKTCIGLDISGRPVIDEWENVVSDNNLQVDIKITGTTAYMINREKCYFSSIQKNKTNLSLFADDEERPIKLVITNIGNTWESSFMGTHELSISVLRNHITTILIRKHPTEPNAIQTEVNPNIVWNDNYPPLDYIELNN